MPISLLVFGDLLVLDELELEAGVTAASLAVTLTAPANELEVAEALIELCTSRCCPTPLIVGVALIGEGSGPGVAGDSPRT